MQISDAKDYFLEVSNDEGKLLRQIKVIVVDEVFELEIVVSIVIGVVLSILILSLVILYSQQARRPSGENSINTICKEQVKDRTKKWELYEECQNNDDYKPDIVPSQ